MVLITAVTAKFTAFTAKFTAFTAKFHIRGGQAYVVKNCPICGCSEHKLFGCAKHWAQHKKNNEGLCEQKSS